MNPDKTHKKGIQNTIRNTVGGLLLTAMTAMTPQALSALDIQQNGVANVGRIEPLEQSINDAQAYYEAEGYGVPESIIEQYLTQEEHGYMPERDVLRAGSQIDLTELPNLDSYRATSSISQQQSSPLLENRIDGTLEGTYMVPRVEDGNIEFIIKPVEGGESAVLTRRYMEEGEAHLETYQTDLGQPGVPPLNPDQTYALSTLNNQGNDELEIGGQDHYVFRFTSDEVRELGLTDSVLTLVEYNNPDAERGAQDGGRAANEVGREHNKFYFDYNGETGTVDVSQSEDGPSILQLNLGNGPTPEQAEQPAEESEQNYPTEFGVPVINYDAEGMLSVEEMNVQDQNGIEEIAVRLTDVNGIPVTNVVGDTTQDYFTLDEITQSHGVFQRGIVRDSDLGELPAGETEYTLRVTDELGNTATKAGVFTIAEPEQESRETIYTDVKAQLRDSTIDLSGTVQDADGLTRAYMTLVNTETDERVEINPDHSIDPQSIYLDQHFNDDQTTLDIDDADITLEDALENAQQYVIRLHTEDAQGNESTHDIPVETKSPVETSVRYGIFNNDGLELALGTETRFGTRPVLYGMTEEQQPTLLDVPETYGQLGVGGRFIINDNEVSGFNANAVASFLLGSSQEGLQSAEGAEINNYLREATDILVQAGYNPRVLDGLVELAVNGMVGLESSKTELNETYPFVFNEGGSTINMTDRRTQEESAAKYGVAGGIKVNPLDWLSVGATVESLWYNGDGSITNKNLSTINEQTTSYNIDGNTTRAVAEVGLYLGRLADLHDLVLNLSAGYEWNSVERTSSDYVSPLNASQPEGFVGGAELQYNFDDRVRGIIGYGLQNDSANNETYHSLNIGVRINPGNLFDSNRD